MHWESWWWPSPKAPKKHKNTQVLLQVQHLKHDLIHLLDGIGEGLFPGSLQGWRIFKWRFEPLESHHIPGFLKNAGCFEGHRFNGVLWSHCRKSHVIRQGYCVFLCGVDRGLTFWIRELGAAQLPCWNRWNFAWRCARIAGSTCSSAKFSQIRMVVPLLGKPPHAMLWRFAERTGIFHEILGYIEILLGCFGMCWVSIFHGYLVPWCMLTTTHATTWHGCRAKMLFEMRGTAKPMSHLLRVRIELVDSNRETPLKKIKLILYSKIHINGNMVVKYGC